MELTVGKWTNKELAEWFGISDTTFNHHKMKKLEELKEYAEYTLDHKKVVIQKVLKPIYVKKRSKRYRTVRNAVDKTWAEDGLDSCSRVSDEIYTTIDLEASPVTVYEYTREARNELYGKPFSDDGGLLGNCIYLWCKKDEEGNLSQFTPEENKIKQELKMKYFGDVSEKALFVKEMVDQGEIKKEDAWQALEDLTCMTDVNFFDFLQELQDKTGSQVIRGTFVRRDGIKYMTAKKKGLIEI